MSRCPIVKCINYDKLNPAGWIIGDGSAMKELRFDDRHKQMETGVVDLIRCRSMRT